MKRWSCSFQKAILWQHQCLSLTGCTPTFGVEWQKNITTSELRTTSLSCNVNVWVVFMCQWFIPRYSLIFAEPPQMALLLCPVKCLIIRDHMMILSHLPLLLISLVGIEFNILFWLVRICYVLSLSIIISTITLIVKCIVTR